MIRASIQGSGRRHHRQRLKEAIMYTRITTGRYDSGKEQDVRRLVESDVLNAARKLAGFKSYNGALDRKAGKLAAITTWETEEQARTFRDKIGSDIMKQIQDLGVQLDEAQIYETVIDA
jgi:hypothetical protein